MEQFENLVKMYSLDDVKTDTKHKRHDPDTDGPLRDLARGPLDRLADSCSDLVRLQSELKGMITHLDNKLSQSLSQMSPVLPSLGQPKSSTYWPLSCATMDVARRDLTGVPLQSQSSGLAVPFKDGDTQHTHGVKFIPPRTTPSAA